MTAPVNNDELATKRVEHLIEWGFVITAFAIFFLGIVVTLGKPAHESAAGEDHGHPGVVSEQHH